MTPKNDLVAFDFYTNVHLAPLLNQFWDNNLSSSSLNSSEKNGMISRLPVKKQVGVNTKPLQKHILKVEY